MTAKLRIAMRNAYTEVQHHENDTKSRAALCTTLKMK